jgi:hypothetical protein
LATGGDDWYCVATNWTMASQTKALLKSGMIGSFAPNHPALFSCQESATPIADKASGKLWEQTKFLVVPCVKGSCGDSSY